MKTRKVVEILVLSDSFHSALMQEHPECHARKYNTDGEPGDLVTTTVARRRVIDVR